VLIVTLVSFISIRDGQFDTIWHGVDSFGNVCGIDNTDRHPAAGKGGNLGLDLRKRPQLFEFPSFAQSFADGTSALPAAGNNTAPVADLASPLRICIASCPTVDGDSIGAIAAGLCLRLDSPTFENAAYMLDPAELGSTGYSTATGSVGCPVYFQQSVAVAHRCQLIDSNPLDSRWHWLLSDAVVLQNELAAAVGLALGLPAVMLLVLCYSHTVFFVLVSVLPPVSLAAASTMLFFEAQEFQATRAAAAAAGVRTITQTSDSSSFGIAEASAISGSGEDYIDDGTTGSPTTLVFDGTLVYTVAWALGFAASVVSLVAAAFQLRWRRQRLPILGEGSRMLRRQPGLVVVALAYGAVFCGVVVVGAASVLHVYGGESDNRKQASFGSRYHTTTTNPLLLGVTPWLQCLMAVAALHICRACVAGVVSAAAARHLTNGAAAGSQCCGTARAATAILCCHCGSMAAGAVEAMVIAPFESLLMYDGIIKCGWLNHARARRRWWCSWCSCRCLKLHSRMGIAEAGFGFYYGQHSDKVFSRISDKRAEVVPPLSLGGSLALQLQFLAVGAVGTSATVYTRLVSPDLHCPSVLVLACLVVAFFVAAVVASTVRSILDALVVQELLFPGSSSAVAQPSAAMSPRGLPPLPAAAARYAPSPDSYDESDTGALLGVVAEPAYAVPADALRSENQQIRLTELEENRASSAAAAVALADARRNLGRRRFRAVAETNFDQQPDRQRNWLPPGVDGHRSARGIVASGGGRGGRGWMVDGATTRGEVGTETRATMNTHTGAANYPSGA
jgi:hypothetical protein